MKHIKQNQDDARFERKTKALKRAEQRYDEEHDIDRELQRLRHDPQALKTLEY